MEGSTSDAQLDVQLKLFASYSPAEVVLRYAFAANPTPPSGPEANDFEGVIGFVDVSGFTALSERLNKDHGRKGAEMLNTCERRRPKQFPTHCIVPRKRYIHAHFRCDHGLHNRYINKYFEELIEGIFSFSGDVIKFAGDALQVPRQCSCMASCLPLASRITREPSWTPTNPCASHGRSCGAIVTRQRRRCHSSSCVSTAPKCQKLLSTAGQNLLSLVTASCMACWALPCHESTLSHTLFQGHRLKRLRLSRVPSGASKCCLDLLTRLNNYEVVPGVTLRLHVGIGAGTISEFYLGGYGGTPPPPPPDSGPKSDTPCVDTARCSPCYP